MPSVIAHRGGALLWPENSRRAIQGASALGVDQIQLDVRLSADGEVVVIHDATLDRTTNGTGLVEAQDWDALQRCRLVDTDEPILRLAEAAAAVAAGPALLRLEVKGRVDGQLYPDLASKIPSIVAAAGMADRTILSAFGMGAMEELALVCPALPRALLVDGQTLTGTPILALIDRARALGCIILGARWSAWAAAQASDVLSSGLRLCCFGCNDAAALKLACQFSADEVMTDRPDLALQIAGP